jgi:hypothetical protein
LAKKPTDSSDSSASSSPATSSAKLKTDNQASPKLTEVKAAALAAAASLPRTSAISTKLKERTVTDIAPPSNTAPASVEIPSRAASDSTPAVVDTPSIIEQPPPIKSGFKLNVAAPEFKLNVGAAEFKPSFSLSSSPPTSNSSGGVKSPGPADKVGIFSRYPFV